MSKAPGSDNDKKRLKEDYPAGVVEGLTEDEMLEQEEAGSHQAPPPPPQAPREKWSFKGFWGASFKNKVLVVVLVVVVLIAVAGLAG